MSNLTTTSRCGGWCCATQSQRASYFSCTAFPRRSTHGTPLPLSLLITLKSIRSIGRIWPVLTAIDGQIFLCARDYARVLKEYIAEAGLIDRHLIIYATDIGGLPALLAAIEEPGVARTIIVGDFAPFNRPQYMLERLRDLKAPRRPSRVRTEYYQNSDRVIENAFKGGLPSEAQFPISTTFKQDMLKGWNQGELTSGDAFYHYYSHFTRDENYLEANISRLRTPVKVVWGEKDIYINREMGIEFAEKAKADFTLLPELVTMPIFKTQSGPPPKFAPPFNEVSCERLASA